MMRRHSQHPVGVAGGARVAGGRFPHKKIFLSKVTSVCGVMHPENNGVGGGSC